MGLDVFAQHSSAAALYHRLPASRHITTIHYLPLPLPAARAFRSFTLASLRAHFRAYFLHLARTLLLFTSSLERTHTAHYMAFTSRCYRAGCAYNAPRTPRSSRTHRFARARACAALRTGFCTTSPFSLSPRRYRTHAHLPTSLFAGAAALLRTRLPPPTHTHLFSLPTHTPPRTPPSFTHFTH